jgi:hypothetical protein
VPKPKISDEDFARLYQSQSVAQTAADLQLDERAVYRRRRAVEDRLGIELRSALGPASVYKPRLEFKILDGVVIIGGDGHYWPGEATTAHRAMVFMCKSLKPKAVIMNGDAFDGATISRHPPTWAEAQPTVLEEIEAVSTRLRELEKASGRCYRAWTLGNHDARFEMKLAAVAHQYRGIKGMHLRDHFPLWEPCWSIEIGPFWKHPQTGEEMGYENLMVKHRFKGGMHAAHNNALWAGRSIVTNHLHSPKVTPITDYNGTRYGVDTGCLCDPKHPAFSYTEDNPLNWRSGFAVFTWVKGELLYPELVTVKDEKKGLVQFRGKVFKV